jgi:hypothetical protein
MDKIQALIASYNMLQEKCSRLEKMVNEVAKQNNENVRAINRTLTIMQSIRGESLVVTNAIDLMCMDNPEFQEKLGKRMNELQKKIEDAARKQSEAASGGSNTEPGDGEGGESVPTDGDGTGQQVLPDESAGNVIPFDSGKRSDTGEPEQCDSSVSDGEGTPVRPKPDQDFRDPVVN